MTSTRSRSTERAAQKMLRSHLAVLEADEAQLIEFYAHLADEAPEPLRGLVAAMLSDGAAHHQMLEKLLTTWGTPPPAEATGKERWHLDPHSPSTDCFLAARRFLESERSELARLQCWAAESDSHQDRMFFTLLLRLLELDAAKHTAVLDFVRHTTDPITVT